MPHIPLLSRLDDGVLVLTLNRPERRNALTPELYEQLLEALQDAAVAAEVGAVVLTGAGQAFCAGGDVTRMASRAEPLDFEYRVARLRRRARICELLHTMPKPTLAMMRGPAVGAGLSLALACDMRLGDASVRMRTGFLQVGLPGDYGGHYFLPRLVGMAKARELYLTSPMLDADSAQRLGLLNQVHASERLEPAAMELAAGWARGPRTALAYLKQNLNQGLQDTLGGVLDGEAWRHVRCTETEDHKEAARAFTEKRTPRFGRHIQTTEG
ncbi:enoyl-CoA hydratase [Bordetella petrii]|uniref:enoyl-CoA hydratase n=1 Tax=Bordetella petrii TaxID=94624 RepID=UPI001E6503C5|nr:enoyl-CoA hydratase [Bordetella petrii]MCD0501454.1 enoyl-CoA hydratase [Bordetella petrii]